MSAQVSGVRTLRRIGMCVVAGICLSAIESPVRATSPRQAFSRPNIILIYTDDQDRDELGCYGGDVATPDMDSLARDGARFTRFYVASPVCTPSRYNVLSGRYASRSRRLQETFPPGGPVNIGWETLVVGEKILPHVLQANGYATITC